MGRNLHPQILGYFSKKMREHRLVTKSTDISDSDNYLFRVERALDMSPVTIHLSDSYFYGDVEYNSRPLTVREGDFILIARPEGVLSSHVIDTAKEDMIGIGHIGKLMGALHRENVWLYQTAEERNNT